MSEQHSKEVEKETQRATSGSPTVSPHRDKEYRLPSLITGCVVALDANEDDAASVKASLQTLLGWTDEQLVLRRGGDARLEEVARQYGAKLVTIPPGDPADVARNRAADEAQGSWLFFLDTHERVPAPLGPLLCRLLTEQGDQFDAISLPIKHYFCGKWIEHCHWWPGYGTPQLLKKGRFSFDNQQRGGVPVAGEVAVLPADNPDLAIERHAFDSIHRYLTDLNRYTDADAEVLLSDGCSHSWRAMLAAFARDWQVYYDHGEAHRDGTHGFVLSFLSAFSRFIARAKLWDLRRRRNQLVNPAEPLPGSVAEAVRFLRQALSQLDVQNCLRPHAVPTLQRVPASWLPTPDELAGDGVIRLDVGTPGDVSAENRSLISACLVVRNEAHLIEDALRSVSGWTRRIIFIDNDSVDDTVVVARRYTDTILTVRGVQGHLEVVRAAAADEIERLAFAGEEGESDTPTGSRWLLFLDADERIPPRLATTLVNLVERHGQDFEALFLPFKWFFCGRWIRHGGKWPGYKAAPQMIKEGAYRFNPHVHWGGEITGRPLYLPADDPDLAVLHYSVDDVAHFLYKENRSTTQEVALRDDQGWDHSWRAQMAHFVLEWQDAYDHCGASRDGMHGFLLAFLQGMSRYFVRAKVWDYRQQQGIAAPERLPGTVAEILDFWERVLEEGADQWLPRLSLAPGNEQRQQETATEGSHTTPAHLGGHSGITNMDEPILDYLIERFGVKSLVDLGCGPGGMVQAARQGGLVALGIDGDASVAPDILHDFTTGPLTIEKLASCLPRPLLVWCVEFVEHVESRFVPNFIPVFSLGDIVFLTHALPGQGGHHHVNERSPEYWAGVLATVGLAPERDATVQCREVASNQFTRNTGTLFQR